MRSRGMTLIEIVVASSLALLLLGMLFSFLVPTMRASVRGQARVELQQQAVLALNKISADLQRTASAGVSLITPSTPPPAPPSTASQTEPGRLGIVRIQDVLPDGRQQWETKLVVYSWDPPTGPPGVQPGAPLIRKVWDKTKDDTGLDSPLNNLDSTKPLRFSDPTLIAVKNATAAQIADSRVLATGVTRFYVDDDTTGPGPTITQPIRIVLRIERKAATGRSQNEVFELERKVSLRNRL